jgi:SWI/SNF-related matrix-associated actin-dependent regulator 1 of chromatin subfamily A
VQLDFIASTGAFVLRVPRGVGHPEPHTLMSEHGLDFSTSRSTSSEAMLFTREPYAAVAFWQYATPRAREQLITLQTQIDLSWAKESKGHIDVPDDEELAPFQVAGVEYALRRMCTLFGDVPGLGKSPEAMAVCNEVKAKRVLIVCPANIRLQWVKVVRRWTTMKYPYTVYPVLHGRHGINPAANFTIVSYDLASSPSIWRALSKLHFDVLILDEAHYCKTVDARRTRTVFGGGLNPLADALFTRADMILGLTGTPLPNRPREAYTLARGLCYDAIDFMSEDTFKSRFNPSRRVVNDDGKVFIDERAGRHGELQARLRSNFMVRREKYGPNGVGYQLGMMHLPQYEVIQVEETKEVKRALAAERMLDIDPEELEGVDAECLGQVATVRRLMGLAMAPLAAEYVDMLLDGGEEKIVVFAHHIQVLDLLCSRLAKWGVVRIDGSLSQQKKQKRVDDFRLNPRIQLCIGNMQSMGTGTDGLQEVCHRAVFAEPDWVSGTNQQCVDRLDRGGQNVKVQADFLVAPGSFVERILGSALRKGQTTFKALDRVMGDL